MMKKYINSLFALLLFAGCTQQATQPAPTPTPTPLPTTPEASAEAEKPGTMLGGWTVFADNNVSLMPEDQTRFEKALEGWTGVGYEPLTVLATQVVSGTNYAYLAKGTTITANPGIGYYVVTIYENLSGETEILCIKDLDFVNPIVTEDAPEQLAGGWTVTNYAKPGMLPGEDIESSFVKAQETHVGVALNPIALLGTQVVSGTNYCALCRGATVTPDAITNLYLVTWNQDLQGNSKILEVKRLDINYYVDPSVQ
ncbi:MAG: hypothetical protein IKE51_02255 [Solobacterium sp.]|nr:hypothetical protein [Solobacterium sp.]